MPGPTTTGIDNNMLNSNDLIRKSVHDKFSGSTKIITHLDHIGHCKAATGKNRSTSIDQKSRHGQIPQRTFLEAMDPSQVQGHGALHFPHQKSTRPDAMNLKALCAANVGTYLPELRGNKSLVVHRVDPRQSLRTSIKSQFLKSLITFGDKCSRNGSKNVLTAPRTSLG